MSHPGTAPTQGPPPLARFFARPGQDPLTGAFPARAPVMPWRGATPVDPAEVAGRFAALLRRPRSAPTVVYVHVPFCHAHCLFCGFYRERWTPERSAPYVDSLLAEIAGAAATALVAEGPPIAAVYLGGGTPTALDTADLVRLVAGLRRFLPLAPGCEITLEGRLHGFGLAKAEAAIAAGVNRISLGVQTFDTTVRRRLGRKASRAQLERALADLVALDAAAIVADLIYGLPGQDAGTWQLDLATVHALGLDGVDLYALNVWQHGPLARAIARERVPPAASLAEQARAYDVGMAQLADAGWTPISQAHLRRTARERNRYNRLIKDGATCLAFGAGAGGSAHGHAWRTIADLDRRAAALAAGRLPVEAMARLPPDHAARTRIAGGLDVGRVDLAALEAEAPGFAAAAAPLLDDWTAAGLVAIADGTLATTRAGAFWAANLTTALHTALDHVAAERTTKRPAA